MKEEKLNQLSIAKNAEHSLSTTYVYSIWRKFTKALKIYNLISENDKICVCISGGKDSMLMALLFKHLHKYSDFKFDLKFIVMDPGYNKINRALIEENLTKLEIPASIIKTDIFKIANNSCIKPCYLCAKMRRGALYRIAKMFNCNKIALGHHYDDVIVTTLMNIFNAGSFQTMLPKLHSDNYLDIQLIRPMYLIRENDIINWANYNDLHFIKCACKFVENTVDDLETSKRLQTKLLIEKLKNTYSENIEQNIFKAATNCNLDMILGYKENGNYYNYLDSYDEKAKIIKDKIILENRESDAISKAEKDHQKLIIDKEFYFD